MTYQFVVYSIGQHEVSNERFAAFVKSTGYVTEAERFGNSFVVEQFVRHYPTGILMKPRTARACTSPRHRVYMTRQPVVLSGR